MKERLDEKNPKEIGLYLYIKKLFQLKGTERVPFQTIASQWARYADYSGMRRTECQAGSCD